MWQQTHYLEIPPILAQACKFWWAKVKVFGSLYVPKMVELGSFSFWKDFQVQAQTELVVIGLNMTTDWYELENYFQKAGFNLSTSQGSNFFTTLTTKLASLSLSLSSSCVWQQPHY